MAGERGDTETTTETESGSEGPVVATDGGDPVTVQLPEDLGEWLDDQVADDPDRDRADVLRALAAAYREIDAGGEGAAHSDLLDRLDAQREEYVDLVEDVRERVVDLRHEIDDRAAADHDHAVKDLEDLPERLERLESEIDRLEAHVDEGFENYETVLGELTDAVDDLSDRVDTLASAVVSGDGGTENGDEADALDRLKRAANEAGTREATCGDCGATVDVGLLTEPECPHCRSRFVDLIDDGGLFGSPTLDVDDPPSLQGAAAADGGDPS